MLSMKVIKFFAASASIASAPLHAVTETYTVIDLLSVATFPSVTPIINGTSLVFDCSQQHLKMA
jgi:hypothetical protein